MKRTFGPMAATFCLLLTHAVTASARPVRIWSPTELWEKADAVVIATVESAKDGFVAENTKAETWVPVSTTFDVQTVFKGKPEQPAPGKLTIAVQHYRYFDRQALITVIDGPAFVSFNPKTKNRYLIFLKQIPGGRYEPLTGQYDPHFSFQRLEAYDGSKEQ